MTYATREEARAAALAEGRRIRYEEEVMDRAWHLLHRPPRTKPQPHFPEPARNKTHWDHLLEEMKWLSGDFVRERKFRHKLARKAAYAVARSNLDLESRVIKRAQDEAAAQRKTARNIANEVMHFWIKIEKVVRFKAQSAIDAKRKTVMDKHLDFLLGQTERYSTMLATKLTGGEGGESSGRSTPRSASVERSRPCPRETRRTRMPTSIERTTTRWPLRTTRRRWKRRCAAPKRRTKATPPRRLTISPRTRRFPSRNCSSSTARWKRRRKRRRPGAGRQAGGRLHG